VVVGISAFVSERAQGDEVEERDFGRHKVARREAVAEDGHLGAQWKDSGRSVSHSQELTQKHLIRKGLRP
jgi:hypothetical protein